jgi:hypothetical protein
MNFLPNPSSNYQQYDSLSSGGVGSVAALWALNKAGLLTQDQMNNMLLGNKNMSGNMLNNYLKSPSGGKPPPSVMPVNPNQPTSMISPSNQDTQVAGLDNDIIDQSLPNFANALSGTVDFGGASALGGGLMALA